MIAHVISNLQERAPTGASRVSVASMPSGAMGQVTTDASGLALLPVEREPVAGELTLWGDGPARKIR